MPVEFAAPPPSRNTPNVSSGTAKASKAVQARETAEREEAVAQLGMFAQVPLLATKQLADAAAVGMHWPGIAKEVAKLAESQEAVANLIDPLIKVGPYAGLIAATLPLVMQLAVNHGRVKPGSMGTVPAVSLQSKMETAIAQEELKAMRVQLEAEREAQAIRAEIENERKMMVASVSAE